MSASPSPLRPTVAASAGSASSPDLRSFLPVCCPRRPPLPVLANHTPDPARSPSPAASRASSAARATGTPACAATHLAYDAADDVWQGIVHRAGRHL